MSAFRDSGCEAVISDYFVPGVSGGDFPRRSSREAIRRYATTNCTGWSSRGRQKPMGEKTFGVKVSRKEAKPGFYVA
jgi:hypothetical protein